jgi:2-polyprenyl-6-hydroxyphenyl methylase/3-demethylubiquinone-9 3-methyltransferase
MEAIMKQPFDKVTEAYFGEVGNNEFAQKTRDRIHWVCKQAKGEKILDVGCSQGIADIILGREGKSVIALDVLEESINYAKEMLENESDDVKEKVDFQTANFMTYDFKDEKFDVIIFSEVLEHITEPKRFLEKAEKLLNDEGIIIVTLPFGINDFFDHKRTYYIMGALEFLTPDLTITEYKFLGNWLGFTVKKGAEELDLCKLFTETEENFYLKERTLTDERTRLKKRQKELFEKNTVLIAEKKELIETHKKQKNNLIAKSEQLLKEKAKIEEQLKRLFDGKIEIEEKLTHVSNKKEHLLQQIGEQSKALELEQKHSNTLKKTLKKLEEENRKLRGSWNAANEKLEASTEENRKLRSSWNNARDEVEAVTNKNQWLRASWEKEKEKVAHYHETLLKQQTEKLIMSRKEKIGIENLLIESYKKEQTMLKSYTNLKESYDALEKKYGALSNSRFGKMALSYWKLKKKRK